MADVHFGRIEHGQGGRWRQSD